MSPRRSTDAVEALALIEAANAEEEALAIAVALREAIDDARRRTRTAALVTPDRALARRVIAALGALERRGRRFRRRCARRHGRPGIFARLAAEAALGGLAPVTLLALLKHPLLRLGAAPTRMRVRFRRSSGRCCAVRVRGRAAPGSCMRWRPSAPSDAPKLHRSDPRSGLTERDLDAAADLVDRLAAALAPLEALSASALARSPNSLRGIARSIAALSRAETGDAGGLRRPRRRDAVRAPSTTSRTTRPRPASRSRRATIRDLFRAAIADRVVRRPGRARRARAHLRSARGAAAERRPRRARRAGRRRVAAGGAHRPVAQPADARTRSASTCRSGASRSPRTTSRRCSARRRSC